MQRPPLHTCLHLTSGVILLPFLPGLNKPSGKSQSRGAGAPSRHPRNPLLRARRTGSGRRRIPGLGRPSRPACDRLPSRGSRPVGLLPLPVPSAPRKKKQKIQSPLLPPFELAAQVRSPAVAPGRGGRRRRQGEDGAGGGRGRARVPPAPSRAQCGCGDPAVPARPPRGTSSFTPVIKQASPSPQGVPTVAPALPSPIPSPSPTSPRYPPRPHPPRSSLVPTLRGGRASPPFRGAHSGSGCSSAVPTGTARRRTFTRAKAHPRTEERRPHAGFPWCSGHHARLTRERSPVRDRAGTACAFLPPRPGAIPPPPPEAASARGCGVPVPGDSLPTRKGAPLSRRARDGRLWRHQIFWRLCPPQPPAEGPVTAAPRAWRVSRRCALS